jgi:hypothetical protein
MYENMSKESNTNTDSLNNTIKKLNEQIENNKKLLEDKNKEKKRTK